VFKTQLITGISDADQSVRKAARVLFWVMKRRGGSFAASMDAVMSSLDPSAQRHLKGEATLSGDDIEDLFRKPDAIFNVDTLYSCGASALNADTVPQADRPPRDKPSVRPHRSIPADDSPASPVSAAGSGFSATTGAAAHAAVRNSSLSKARAAEAAPPVTGGLSVGPLRASSARPAPSARGAAEHPSGSAETSALSKSGPVRRSVETDNVAPAAAPVMSLAAARELRETKSGTRRLSVATGVGSGSGPLSSSSRKTPSFSRPSQDSGFGIHSQESSKEKDYSADSSSVPRGSSSNRGGASSSEGHGLTDGPKRVFMTGNSKSASVSAASSKSALASISAPAQEAAAPVVHTATSAESVSVSGSRELSGASELVDYATVEKETIPRKRERSAAAAEETPESDGGGGPIPGMEKEEKEDVTTLETPLPALRVMVSDPDWDTRLKALLEIKFRLGQCLPAGYVRNGIYVGPPKRSKSQGDSELLGQAPHRVGAETIEVFVDIAVAKIGDPHSRVSIAALDIVHLATVPVEVARFDPRNPGAHEGFVVSKSGWVIGPLLNAASALSRMGQLLPNLFGRLADRRPAVRDKSNEVLNNIRASYDANLLVAALSPRLTEVSDRVRTAVVQFLLTIVPLCELFFASPSNTGAFLGRMAYILGSAGGPKPSTALALTSRRLLELVHKCCPQVSFIAHCRSFAYIKYFLDIRLF
jgi:hypothetical protein